MDIAVQGLKFAYNRRSKNILDGLSFEANDGKVTAIVGANGAGKTTLVKAIMGFLNPQGRILLGGKERSSYSPDKLAGMVGYLTQESTFQPALTVFEVVMLGRIQHLGLHVGSDETERVWNILRMLDIDKLADSYYSELSGGQRRVVNIAQTIIREPQILILDEPTANLDMQNEIEMLELIREYTRQRNIATLVILHDLNMACRFADSIVVLKDGRVFKSGTPQQVITESNVRDAYGVNVELLSASSEKLMVHVLGSARGHKYDFAGA